MIEIAGCEPQKFKPVCSAIDKLDKISWQEVETELIEEKGLSVDQTTKLKLFVNNRGQIENLLENL